MHNFTELATKEVLYLENALKKIDEFLCSAPEGCLKWQNKKEKTYYYHQFANGDQWARRYIKKGNVSLARSLAQKQYYIAIKPIVKKKLSELRRFLKKGYSCELDKIYDDLSIERKRLIVPLQMSVEERIRQWNSEVYEKTKMHPENLRYDTEQGDIVRSKSEVIIADILYRNRKDILYKYERPLQVVENGRDKTIYPDFTILNKHTGKIMYWEHAGRMDDSYYSNEFVRKMNTYIANDLLPGRDVIVTYETQNVPLDIKTVKHLLKQVVLEKL